MKIYVLVFEPYHENSEILGVYLDKELALGAQRDREDKDQQQWDCTDTYDLQEWDTELGRKTDHLISYNPYTLETREARDAGTPPKKLGWRTKSGMPGAMPEGAEQ